MNRLLNARSDRYAGWTVYVVSIALTLVACAVAVVLRLFSTTDLPFQTFAALIGVIITAIITGVLLKGQSRAERRQKEQAEIFKEKLATYNRFLDALRRYVTEPNARTKKVVIFHSMAIRMHSGADVIDALDDHIIRLIKETGGKDANEEVAALVESLNAIACIFARELYGDTSVSANSLKEFVVAINGALDETSEEEKLSDAASDEKEDKEAASRGVAVTGWQEKLDSLQKQGWCYTPADDAFSLQSDASPVVISVYRKNGKYVVQAAKGDDSEFSQRLKNEFKGSRRYGTWWRELPIGSYGVNQGQLLTTLPSNDRARASVIKWIDKLLNTIN